MKGHGSRVNLVKREASFISQCKQKSVLQSLYEGGGGVGLYPSRPLSPPSSLLGAVRAKFSYLFSPPTFYVFSSPLPLPPSPPHHAPHPPPSYPVHPLIFMLMRQITHKKSRSIFRHVTSDIHWKIFTTFFMLHCRRISWECKYCNLKSDCSWRVLFSCNLTMIPISFSLLL